LSDDASITRLPPDACPQCQYPLDAAGTTDGAAGTPTPGDVSACINCGHPLVYTDTMRVRSMTMDEWKALPDEQRRELWRIRLFAERIYPAMRSLHN
jgi:hypothetical protein